jgi:hypothetical protein
MFLTVFMVSGVLIMNGFSVENARVWVDANKEELLTGLMTTPDVPDFMRDPGSIFNDIWNAGCWLGNMLRGVLKCPEYQVALICRSHGQRSLVDDTYETAAKYLNHYADTGETMELPGPELAEKILREMFSVEQGAAQFYWMPGCVDPRAAIKPENN